MLPIRTIFYHFFLLFKEFVLKKHFAFFHLPLYHPLLCGLGLGNYRLYFLGSVDTADQNDTGRERLLASGSCPLKTAGSFAMVMR